MKTKKQVITEIREALKNNCYAVFGIGLGQIGKHRIISVKMHNGDIYGEVLSTGKWIILGGWELA